MLAEQVLLLLLLLLPPSQAVHWVVVWSAGAVLSAAGAVFLHVHGPQAHQRAGQQPQPVHIRTDGGPNVTYVCGSGLCSTVQQVGVRQQQQQQQ